jgi:2,3-bisphosphoglycerate-dependent phosphoglycerate mutase
VVEALTRRNGRGRHLRQRWPSKLWVVRHGESAGNVARDLADAAGAAMIELDLRDMDVPLSELGERQARSLGHWFRAMPEDERPEVVLASPYIRAVRTAELIGAAERVVVDERLREREFGILDRLTTFGIRERFPEQAEHRRILGKFYHRPPGGESWCDVILRLRSALDTISLHHADRRVLIVGHQVVVLCLRYILEDLTEAEILAIDKAADVANCGVTEYAFEPDCPDDCRPVMRLYNFTAPLDVEGTPVTTAPDAKVAVK